MATKTEIVKTIAEAALYGNLGLFVGTGFSKALTNNRALNYGELLNQVARILDLTDVLDKELAVPGLGYPEVAQRLCEAIAKKDGIEYHAALDKLKRIVANICDWRPDKKTAEQYRTMLKDLPISWIITTNYDFLLEELLDRHTILLPTQVVTQRPDVIPIYHMHGHRRSPSSIVVTQQDYVSQLSTLEYRNLRLLMSLTESVTIMMGYSLGDVNVQMALDWSKRFRDERKLSFLPHQGVVIQALYKQDNILVDPYSSASGGIIVDTDDLLSFLNETIQAIKIEQEQHELARNTMSIWFNDEDAQKKFTREPDLRSKFISNLRNFPRSYDIPRVIDFLDRSFTPLWEKAHDGPSSFYLYSDYLDTILDLLAQLPFEAQHPSLLAFLAEELNHVCYYISLTNQREHGYSWRATETWHSRRTNIPEETLNELRNYAIRQNLSRLFALLEGKSEVSFFT